MWVFARVSYVYPYVHVSECVRAYTQRETAIKAHLREYQRVSVAMQEMVCVSKWVVCIYLFINLWWAQSCTGLVAHLARMYGGRSVTANQSSRPTLAVWESESWSVHLFLCPSVCLFGQLCGSPPRSDSIIIIDHWAKQPQLHRNRVKQTGFKWNEGWWWMLLYDFSCLVSGGGMWDSPQAANRWSRRHKAPEVRTQVRFESQIWWL